MPVLANEERSPSAAPAAGDIARILKVEVPVIVRLAHRKLTLKEVLRLAHGSILELNRSSDEPLHLMVNNRVIGEGEPVKVGEHFGLRVTNIGDVRERLGAMKR